MIISLHSDRMEDRKDESLCHESTTMRKRAIVTFFATTLPVTLASITIWKVKQIPSMGTTTYVGLTLVYASLAMTIRPNLFDQGNPFKWWFPITGLIWLLVLSYLVLSQLTFLRCKASLRWGLVTSGIAFMFGMIYLLLGELEYGYNTFWRWLLLNILAFVPLILLGASTDSVFLMFLGAFGFLMDSWRFATFVGYHTGEASVPLQFLVFSFAGMMVGALGIQISKHQDHVKTWAASLVSSINASLFSMYIPVLEGANLESLEPSFEENEA
jgi:hypothetical protein